MRGKKGTRILNIVCMVMIMMAGVVRLVRDHFHGYASNTVIGILFLIAIFIWMNQAKKRLIDPTECAYLVGTAFLMAVLMLVRTVKFLFMSDTYVLARYAWYLYYVPQTLAVLWMFFAVFSIGRPYHYRMDRRWKLLYIPAGIIMIGILTNDIHQLAFRFPNGLNRWYENDYVYGPFYVLAMAWLLIFFITILVIALHRCAVSENRTRIWMPLLPLAIGIIYTVSYIWIPGGILQELYKSAEMICFVFLGFMEGLIQAHLFPVNDSYETLWRVSSIRGGLLDQDDQFCYLSEPAIRVSVNQVKHALKQSVVLEDHRTLLRSHEIPGGIGYWVKDISDILDLNQKLADLGDVLTEENAMLEGENRLREKHLRIAEKMQLYDEMAQAVRPQLEMIEYLIQNPAEEEVEFEKQMKYGCILTVYVKRYSNLLLLYHQNTDISSSELWLAVSESIEYVKLYGVKAYVSYSGEEKLPGKVMLVMYRVLEQILESSIPGCDALFVILEFGDRITLRAEVNAPTNVITEEQIRKECEPEPWKLQIQMEDETEYITLTFERADHSAGGEVE